MPVGILLLIVQIGFAVHAVKTGRETYWVYIIIFIPGIGCAIYFLTQVLPELGQSHTVRKAGNSLIKAVDPERELRRRKEEIEIADTIENRMNLANECIDAGFSAEAVTLLEGCLKRGHEGDPHILLRLARALFDSERYKDAKEVLENIIEKNPSFKSHEGHLLYVRSLEEIGLTEDAVKEYEVVSTSFPGEEARVRYGLLLQKIGRHTDAKNIFNESLLRAKRAPKYYPINLS